MSRKLPEIGLVLALALWLPLAMETTPHPAPFPLWPCELALLAIAVLLVAGAKPDEARRVPVTLGASAIRSLLGAIVLGVGAEVFGAQTLMATPSGLGSWTVHKSLLVATGTSMGLLLGPLAVFEHRAATRSGRSSALLAAGLAAWASFVALCLGCLEAHYLEAMTDAEGLREAVRNVQEAGSQLLESPRWTLLHLGWCALPVGAVTWSRLRGGSLPGQVTLALAVSGAAWELFPEKLPLETCGLLGLSIGLPLVFLASDRIAKRLAREVSSSPEQEAPPRWPWIAAVILCALSVLPFLGRELAARAREQVPAWRPLIERGRAPDLRARLDALEREAAPVLSDVALVPLSATSGEVAPLLDRLHTLGARASAVKRDILQMRTKLGRVSQESWSLFIGARENGGGPTKEEQAEIETARDACNDELRILFALEREANRLVRKIDGASIQLSRD